MSWITQFYCNLTINLIRWPACNCTECVLSCKKLINDFICCFRTKEIEDTHTPWWVSVCVPELNKGGGGGGLAASCWRQLNLKQIRSRSLLHNNTDVSLRWCSAAAGESTRAHACARTHTHTHTYSFPHLRGHCIDSSDENLMICVVSLHIATL